MSPTARGLGGQITGLGANPVAAARLVENAASPQTRATYARALRQLGVWLDGRPLDDRNLAAYLRTLQKAGRAQVTAGVVVSAARRAMRANWHRTAYSPARPSTVSAVGTPPRVPAT